MRGKSFGAELKCMCVCAIRAHTHLDSVWMSPQCQGYICGRVVQVGSLKTQEGAAGGERERKKGRADCGCIGGGLGVSEQS